MKNFSIPDNYRSPLIAAIKQFRKQQDKLKKDFSPTLLDLGTLKIYLARHFGFCYGVENAIEIAFRTIQENKGKNIFLLSEMIHNPQVNADLERQGIRFLHDTLGNPLIPLSALQKDDIVLIPAFGTTLAMEKELQDRGIPTEKYNTTCPFVEKVWNRSEQIAAKGYTIVIHGKPKHEETRATFSHAAAHAPSIILNDMKDAIRLAGFIQRERPAAEFWEAFKGMYSPGFDPEKHLQKIGVVNQTTQLAADTMAIAEYLKQVIMTHYGLTTATLSAHFADTRDTLCYATNDNQTAVTAMLETPAHLALVIGGYNSSNTTHLVELCEEKLPAYFITSEENLHSKKEISHFDYPIRQTKITRDYLPAKEPISLLMTSGASCPDAIVEKVIRKLAVWFDKKDALRTLQAQFS